MQSITLFKWFLAYGEQGECTGVECKIEINSKRFSLNFTENLKVNETLKKQWKCKMNRDKGDFLLSQAAAVAELTGEWSMVQSPRHDTTISCCC
ncbi:hypothetical protein T03_16572 [Trichinella britovi]|uniref:Uncharacterized protein n=1 Tax=Trichinella britovi TaxID=45882 RepID=A0A0V1CQR2_TRIBR|nr:hypothetical protein T03_16572 [Trichinella britovi]